MHDPEKSDSAVVAGKSPNKAGPPAAEAAEQRAGTKGNADQQSTHRTQTRARVTQALSRVRQAARQRKKERFTALLHQVNVDTLQAAFYALKRKAAAGVDGVTWQDYEVNLERNLEDLHGRAHRGASLSWGRVIMGARCGIIATAHEPDRVGSTPLSAGPMSTVRLDKFVYDPNKRTALLW